MWNINIEEEKIKISEAWKNAEEIKEEIKTKIEVGNFDITEQAVVVHIDSVAPARLTDKFQLFAAGTAGAKDAHLQRCGADINPQNGWLRLQFRFPPSRCSP